MCGGPIAKLSVEKTKPFCFCSFSEHNETDVVSATPSEESSFFAQLSLKRTTATHAEPPKDSLVSLQTASRQLICGFPVEPVQRGRVSHLPLARGHKQAHTCLWNTVPLIWNVNSEGLCPGLPIKTTFTGGNLTPLGVFSFSLVFFSPRRLPEARRMTR